MPKRRYDEEEVALILHRAVDPAAGNADTGDPGKGLTLTELKLACTLGVGPILTFGSGALAAALGAATPFIVIPVALAGGACALLPWKFVFGREKRSLQRVLDALEHRLLELG